MHIEQKGKYSRITLSPGEYFSTSSPSVLSTLLGSCVAVCLYDPGRSLVGMNHFLLSNPRYSRDLPLYATEAGRYGIHAMELLINDMILRGARRNHLRAKVFGGASILVNRDSVGNFACVGEVNCRFIREFLGSEKIPVVASDLGGESGRVIHFSNGDFVVYVRKIDRTHSERVAARDRRCWEKAIAVQETMMPQIDLWQDV